MELKSGQGRKIAGLLTIVGVPVGAVYQESGLALMHAWAHEWGKYDEDQKIKTTTTKEKKKNEKKDL